MACWNPTRICYHAEVVVLGLAAAVSDAEVGAAAAPVATAVPDAEVAAAAAPVAAVVGSAAAGPAAAAETAIAGQSRDSRGP